MQTKRLNIAIRPSKELENYIFQIVDQFNLCGEMLFALDGVGYYPHATLYFPEFPIEAESKVCSDLASYCINHKAINTTFTQLEAENGYIVVSFFLNDEVFELHKEIVSLINPLRNGVVRTKYLDVDTLNSLPKNQTRNILTYGYPGVMRECKPHMHSVDSKIFQLRLKSKEKLIGTSAL